MKLSIEAAEEIMNMKEAKGDPGTFKDAVMSLCVAACAAKPEPKPEPKAEPAKAKVEEEPKKKRKIFS